MPAFRPFSILAICAAGFVSAAGAADAATLPVSAPTALHEETAAFTLAEPSSEAAEVPESFQTASVGNERAAPTPLVVSAVPEPTSYALMLAGLVALHWVARRRISRPD